MANRYSYPHEGNSKPGVQSVWIHVTGATDVNANGYTVNLGAEHLALTSPVTKTAEGIVQLMLRDTWNKLLSWTVGTNKADTVAKLEAEDVDNGSGNGPLVQFRLTSGGSDADPDSTLLRIRLDLKNSSV